MAIADYFRWAELQPREDVYTYAGTTEWGNHDFYPIPMKERTYSWGGYFAFILVTGVKITTFTLGSSYIAYGLTAGQTLEMVFLGTFVSGCIAYISARPGLDHNMGYTMFLRTAFGLRGVYFPIGIMIITGSVFCYYGGLAFTVLFAAVFTSFHHMKNTLPASSAITTQQLIGYLVFVACYIPCVWFIKPHKLKNWMYPCTIITLCTFFGILGYSVHVSKGFSNGSMRFLNRWNWAATAERISDWTRFSKSRNAPNFAFFIAMPLAVTFSALLGVLTASATLHLTGQVQWNPLVLLQTRQAQSYTPACRAGTFFAGLALFFSQIYVNIANNTVGAGMDIAGLLPKYLSMRRAAMFMVILSILIQPWRFLSQAYIFIQVLSIASTVLFPGSTVIVLCDYYLIRKRKWQIPDLFVGNPSGIYWYNHGVNWNAIGALLLAIWRSIPGLAYSIKYEGVKQNAWARIFEINYFIGAPIAFICYFTFSHINKPRGLGIQVNFPEQEEVLEGVAREPESSDSGSMEKNAIVEEKKVSPEII
ncbi:hypothetical protein N431DRAFT_467091 [Stipitochalara longipes BDJ]|nr:hypothetical protein N431DRAFT_467091 [Stipitochalara longipes BDJ]